MNPDKDPKGFYYEGITGSVRKFAKRQHSRHQPKKPLESTGRKKQTPISGGQNCAKTVMLPEIILSSPYHLPIVSLSSSLHEENHPHIWIRPFRKPSRHFRRHAVQVRFWESNVEYIYSKEFSRATCIFKGQPPGR